MNSERERSCGGARQGPPGAGGGGGGEGAPASSAPSPAPAPTRLPSNATVDSSWQATPPPLNDAHRRLPARPLDLAGLFVQAGAFFGAPPPRRVAVGRRRSFRRQAGGGLFRRPRRARAPRTGRPCRRTAPPAHAKAGAESEPALCGIAARPQVAAHRKACEDDLVVPARPRQGSRAPPPSCARRARGGRAQRAVSRTGGKTCRGAPRRAAPRRTPTSATL